MIFIKKDLGKNCKTSFYEIKNSEKKFTDNFQKILFRKKIFRQVFMKVSAFVRNRKNFMKIKQPFFLHNFKEKKKKF